MKSLAKIFLPNYFIRLVKLVIRQPTVLYRKSVIFTDNWKPFIRTINYKGFISYYSKGTSIIEINGSPPVRFGGTYEPEESIFVVNELLKVSQPVFLDIGANIGLMTLNVLVQVPSTNIFAFEPSPHPRSLFEQTIAVNQLKDRVTLYEYALGAEPGEISFASHVTEHASGDGFIDTGRAGDVEYITVSVQTLDNWWKEVGRPRIDVIKMDTEGSEFWILQGGVEMLYSCQPVIVCEIHPINLHAYPYNYLDILKWLNAHEYSLETLGGTVITSNNFSQFLEICETFVARSLAVKQNQSNYV